MSMHNQTFYQKLHKCNVDRVYDLTVVHPGVKHKLHTHVPEGDGRLNTSWSTLKDQCRCVDSPVCASLRGYGDNNVVSHGGEPLGRAILVCTQQLSRFLYDYSEYS